MKFTNQIIWITGASSGLGRAMALAFARQGATLALSARRTELLESLVNEIDAQGGKAKAYPVDVTQEENIQQCVQHIITDFGKLDVAIANAGAGVIGSIEKLSQTEWQRQLTLNVTGLALTCKHALPHLRKTKGQIVLLGSVAAFIPNPGVGAYGASKAAVHSIGETLQVELAGSGVSCTTIHPGFVDSNITRVDNDGNFNPDAKDPRPANLMWPTEKAARVMVNAIAKRKKVYVFTGHGKFMVTIAKYFPGIARKMMANLRPPE
ncbi:MAG: SDR family oxidoreductase [Cyclobacteriaceae bacterium]|nr:SDR family oxidoreductase [Cyclobacteriaceae bacterium]